MTELAGGRLFTQPPYAVRCCAACGLFYKTAALPPAALAELYQWVDFTKWEPAPGALYPTERAALRFLRRSLLPGGRILDFGCSTGRLLAALATSHRCSGVEINPRAAAVAAARGIHMIAPEALAQHENSFDAVVLADVFEHLPNPLATLQTLASLLRHPGYLLLLTGNADAPACRRHPARFWYFRTPQHLCMLSRRHAGFLCAKLRLRLLHWLPLCHYDVSWNQKFRAAVRDFAWRQYHCGSSPLLRALIGRAPLLRKVRSWPEPPLYTTTRDHVLAVFQTLHAP